MARARNIKPSFFENEDLAELDPYARLLFISLWTQADREGRLENRPKRIGAKAFPYESVNVEKFLDELGSARFIDFYEVDGLSVIQIANFVRHQNPHKNEKPSELPPKPELSNDAARSRVRVISGNVASETEEIGTARADSPLLIPDSPLPHGGKPDAGAPATPPWKTKRFHEQVIAKYHEHCPELPSVRTEFWKGERQKNLNARLAEYPPARELDWWDKFFGYVATIDLLMGRLPPKPGQQDSWNADLGWLVKPENFRKVVENTYTQRGAA